MSNTLTNSIDSMISNKCTQIKCYLEPVILALGIVFNVTFMFIIYVKKNTKSLNSSKPLRYLLISMLACDNWYLLNNLNVWYFFFNNKPDLSSYQIICQLNSYFNYFFTILLESNMLTADWFLLLIIFKSNRIANERQSADRFALPLNKKVTRFSNKAPAEASNRPKNGPNDNYNNNNNNNNRLELVEIKNNNKTVKQTATLQPIRETNFSNLINNFYFKNESAYYDMVFKEKVAIIFNIFIWMYLLSFLLWIKGAKPINVNQKSKLTDEDLFTTNEISVLLPFVNFTRSENSVKSAPLSSSKQSGSSKNTFPKHTSKESDNFNLNLPNFCMTHEFGRYLFGIFVLLLTAFRLFTAVVNILTSVCYHYKFRVDYLESLKASLKRRRSSFTFNDNNSRVLKCSSFYTFFSTKRSFTGAGTSGNSSSSAGAGAGGSEATPGNKLKYESQTNTSTRINSTRFNSHYKHFHFIRHYALVALFYSIIVMPSIFNESIEKINELRKSSDETKSSTKPSPSSLYLNFDIKRSTPSLLNRLNFTSSRRTDDDAGPQQLTTLAKLQPQYTDLVHGNFSWKNLFEFELRNDSSSPFMDIINDIKILTDTQENIKTIIHLAESLAHSFKFILYLIFSTHLKCHFRYIRGTPV